MADLTDAQMFGEQGAPQPIPLPPNGTGARVFEATPGASNVSHYTTQLPDGSSLNTAAPAGTMSDGQMFGPQTGAPSSAAATPSAPQANFQLGFDQGIQRPYDNLAHWADELPGVGGFLNQHITGGNGMTGEQLIASHAKTITDAAAHGQTPSGFGNFVGGALGSAPIAALTDNPWLSGAVGGAVSTQSPDDPRAAALDAALGAVGGKAADLGMGAVSHLISPKLSPNVQLLRDEGVQMTPGQILGGGAQTIESGLDHLPLLGQMIKNGRAASVQSFDTAGINRSLSPIGDALPASASHGYPAIDYAHNALSAKYASILPNVAATPDQEFSKGLAEALSTVPLPKQGQAADYVERNILPYTQNGSLDGNALQAIDSNLGHEARTYGRSPDPDQQRYGAAMGDVQDTVRDMVARQNPAYADDLSNVRLGYANLVRVEGAAAAPGAQDGVFSAAQLGTAVRQADSSVRKNAIARGQGLMQDLSDAGRSVLPSTVPDSGTALRGLMEAGVLGMGAHEAGVLNPITLGAAGALALPYTKAGLAGSRFLLAGQRPQWAKDVGDALESYGRPLIAGPAGAQAAALAQALGLDQSVGSVGR